MKKLFLLAMTMVMVGCGKKEPELSIEKVITPNEAANKLFVEAVGLVSQARTEEKHNIPAAIERYEQALDKVGNIISMYKESDIAVKLVSGETVFTGKSMAQIENRVHGLKVSLNIAEKKVSLNIAENFQQAKITETFVESLPEVSDTGEGNLGVATMQNTKTFKRTEKLTILWDKVSLDTTITEIKVPATFRYHIKLSDPWKLEVREQQCIVIAPALKATTPVAIHTNKIVKRSDEGWARFSFNADEQMAGLEKALTPRLNIHAQSKAHMNAIREVARQSVAEFVRQWLMKEDHWREDRFSTIHIIFADEAEAKDFPAKPTLELN